MRVVVNVELRGARVDLSCDLFPQTNEHVAPDRAYGKQPLRRFISSRFSEHLLLTLGSARVRIILVIKFRVRIPCRGVNISAAAQMLTGWYFSRLMALTKSPNMCVVENICPLETLKR